jgi:hypothetical protein
MLYGKNSNQITTLLEYRNLSEKFASPTYMFMRSVSGTLRSTKKEIELGLISSIEKVVTGELFGDFISMAKSTISEGYKDVSAVLASAALEDALKKYAAIKGLNVEDKEMSKVINALKAESLLKGPQASIIGSYVQLRNKAFHAEWNKIDTPDVKSLISFTEEFILNKFSSEWGQ